MEERISELEDSLLPLFCLKNWKKKKKSKNIQSLRDLWNILQCTKIYTVGITEDKEREKVEKLWGNNICYLSEFEENH